MSSVTHVKVNQRKSRKIKESLQNHLWTQSKCWYLNQTLASRVHEELELYMVEFQAESKHKASVGSLN